jgi:hypothetical protein
MANTEKKEKEGEWLDEDKVVYVPDKYIRDIENSLGKLETARQEFRKVAKGVRPLGEVRVES